jgi:wobble nucleotide-excising tRNase
LISKFIAIRNVGKFVNCNAAGDVTFKKLTLVFGENGQGKTTLGDILRSLSTGNPDYVAGRATLGSEIRPFVQLLVGENMIVSFTNGNWDSAGPRIAIYDSTFIDENVHSGHSIDREHRKNLYEVIVGEEGVVLAKQVDEFDGRIRELNKDIKARGDVVTQHAPRGGTLEAFVALEPIPGLDEAIAAQRAELATLERAQEIKAKPPIREIALPRLPDGFQALLAKTLEDISKEAEARTRAHLETHSKSGGEQWIAQGLSLSNGENCPFCGQSIRALDVVAAFTGYFSSSYAELKRELSATQNTVAEAFGEAGLLATQRVLDSNAASAAFWNQFVDAGLPELSFETVHSAVMGVRQAAQNLVQLKLASPLEVVQADAEFERAVESLRQVEVIAAAYTKAVVGVNERIGSKKRELETGDLAKVRSALNGLLSVQKRFEDAVDKACREYRKGVDRKKVLEAEKAAARKKLDEYSKQVFVQYEARINQLLGIFGATFQIGQTKSSMAGGTVSSSFQIVINRTNVELGGSDAAIGKPCFRNTLSAGDRSTLALAFFIAKLEKDPNLGKTVVLFDDPFTSQDRSRRSHTQRAIHRFAGLCRQVVVFSHDAYFLKQILAIKPAPETKVLQVVTTPSGSSAIDECDVAVLTRSQYIRDYETLKAFADRTEGDPNSVAQAIRPLLESYLRMKQPMAFGSNDNLGSMIGKVGLAAPGNPLHGAARHLNVLDAINAYSTGFHHGEDGSTVADILDTNELRSYVRQTLGIVEAF